MSERDVLEGVRVVELGVWVAGPAACGVLADWGADVIKVEPPAGDPMRRMFGSVGLDKPLPNGPFAVDNRGKRSVVLDLGRDDDRAHMNRLLAGADVFLTNLRPDALERLDLDPDSVTSRWPALIYASVSGYGLDGAERDRAGYDIGAFWARSGIAHQSAAPGDAPPHLRSGLGDHMTGISTVAGIVAALFDRTRTGRGRLVETSLLRTGMYAISWELGIQMTLGKVNRAWNRNIIDTPLVNCYETSDGRWLYLIGVEAARHLPGICRAIGRPELVDDERFATAAAIRRHRGELIGLLDGAFATRTLAEWGPILDAHEVWWAPAQSPAEVVTDPQALANGAIVTIPDGAAGEAMSSVDSPVRFDGELIGTTGPVPAVGEHTEQILGELPPS